MNRSLQKWHPAARMALSVGAALFTALALCLAAALVCAALPDPTARLPLVGAGILCASAFVGGLCGAKLAKETGILTGLLAGGIFLLFPLAASLLLPCAFLPGMLRLLTGVFCAALGAFLGSREPKRRRRRS